jgi:hypothetical protein
MSKKDESEEQVLQQLNLKERTVLSDAYSALAGQQSVVTFQAFTFEEALDATIERIEGKNGLRPNLLARVDAVEQNLVNIVEQLKKQPPEAFQDPDPEEDVSGTLTA